MKRDIVAKATDAVKQREGKIIVFRTNAMYD